MTDFVDSLITGTVNIFKDFKRYSTFWKKYCTYIEHVCECSYDEAHQLIATAFDHSGVFAGSSILEVLLEKTYDDSDVELYFSHDMITYEEIAIMMNWSSDTLARVMRQHEDNSAINGLTILYDYSNDRAQVIQQYKKIKIYYYNSSSIDRSPHSIVSKYFDISILRNTFNGCELNIYDLGLLRSRLSIIFDNDIQLIKKYETRGIVFIGKDKNIPHKKSRTIKRKIKIFKPVFHIHKHKPKIVVKQGSCDTAFDAIVNISLCAGVCIVFIQIYLLIRQL